MQTARPRLDAERDVGFAFGISAEKIAEFAFGRLATDVKIHRLRAYFARNGRLRIEIAGAFVFAEQIFQTLPDDFERFVAFAHPHIVPVPAVAHGSHFARAHGNVKIQFGIHRIAVHAPQIPAQAGAAQHRTRAAIIYCHGQRQYAHVGGALHKDFIFNHKHLQFGEFRFQVFHKILAAFLKADRQIVIQAANPDVIVQHPCAAHPFKQPLDMFAVAHEPQKRRVRANVQRVRADSQEVRGNPVQFSHQHADVFHPFRNLVFNAQHPFHAHRPHVFAVHGSHVVHAVHKRDGLVVGQRFGVFFKAAVQVADVRHHINHGFAIGHHFQPQHAVRGRVLRANVDDHLLRTQVSGVVLARL